MIVYLSFCDRDKPTGQKWLGGALVEIADQGSQRANTRAAIDAAWAAKCNPGGEVLAVDVPQAREWYVRPHLNRLMNRSEADRLFARDWGQCVQASPPRK